MWQIVRRMPVVPRREHKSRTPAAVGDCKVTQREEGGEIMELTVFARRRASHGRPARERESVFERASLRCASPPSAGVVAAFTLSSSSLHGGDGEESRLKRAARTRGDRDVNALSRIHAGVESKRRGEVRRPAAVDHATTSCVPARVRCVWVCERRRRVASTAARVYRANGRARGAQSCLGARSDGNLAPPGLV